MESDKEKKKVSKPPAESPSPGLDNVDSIPAAQISENVVETTGHIGEKQQTVDESADSPSRQLSPGHEQTAPPKTGQLTYQEETVGPESEFGSGRETEEVTGTPKTKTPVPSDVGTVYPPADFVTHGGWEDRMAAGGSPKNVPAGMAGRTRSQFSSNSTQSFRPCQLGPKQKLQKLSKTVIYDPPSKNTSETPIQTGEGGDDLVKPSDSISQISGRKESETPSESVSTVEKLRKQNSTLKRQRQAALEKQREFMMEVNRLQLENTNLQGKIFSAEDTHYESDNILATEKLELAAQNQDLTSEIDRIKLELSVEQNRVGEVTALWDQLQSSLKNVREENERLQNEVRIAKIPPEDISMLATKYELTNDTLKSVCKERETLKNNLIGTQDDLARAQASVQALEGQLRKEAEERALREQELVAKASRIQKMALEQNSYEKKIAELERTVSEKFEENLQYHARVQDAIHRLRTYSAEAADLNKPFNFQSPPLHPGLQPEQFESSQSTQPVTMAPAGTPVTETGPGSNTTPTTTVHLLPNLPNMGPAIRLSANAASAAFTNPIPSQTASVGGTGQLAPPNPVVQPSVGLQPSSSQALPSVFGRPRVDIPPPEKLDVTKGQASRAAYLKWKKKLRSFFELSGIDPILWPKYVPWYVKGFAEESVRTFLEDPQNANVTFEDTMSYIEDHLLQKTNAAISLLELRNLSYDRKRHTLSEFLQLLMEKQMELKGGGALEVADFSVIKAEFLYKLPEGYQDYITWHNGWEHADVKEILEWAEHYEARNATRAYMKTGDRKAAGFSPSYDGPYKGGSYNFQGTGSASNFRNRRLDNRNPHRGRQRFQRSQGLNVNRPQSYTPVRTPTQSSVQTPQTSGKFPAGDRGSRWSQDRKQQQRSRSLSKDRRSGPSRSGSVNRGRSPSVDSKAQDKSIGPCFNCQQMGHYAKNCPKRQRNSTGQSDRIREVKFSAAAESPRGNFPPVPVDPNLIDLFDYSAPPFVPQAGYQNHIWCEIPSSSEHRIPHPTYNQGTVNVAAATTDMIQVEEAQVNRILVEPDRRPTKPVLFANQAERHVDVQLMVEGLAVIAKVDCGASATLLPGWVYADLLKEKGKEFLEERTQPTMLILRTYDGTPINSIKQVVLELDDGKRRGFVPCLIDSDTCDVTGKTKSALLGTNGMALMGYKIVDSEGVQIFPALAKEQAYTGITREFEKRFGHLEGPVSESRAQLSVLEEDNNWFARNMEVKQLIHMEVNRRRKFSAEPSTQMSQLEYEYWYAKLMTAEYPAAVMKNYWNRARAVQTQTGKTARVKREKPSPVQQKTRVFVPASEVSASHRNNFPKESQPRPILKKSALRVSKKDDHREHGKKDLQNHQMYCHGTSSNSQLTEARTVDIPLKETKVVTFQETSVDTIESEEEEPDEKGFCPVELAEDTEFSECEASGERCEGAGKRKFVVLKALSFENQQKRASKPYRFKPLNCLARQNLYLADAVVIPDPYGYFSVEAYNGSAEPVRLPQCRVGYLQEIYLSVPMSEAASEIVDHLYQPDIEVYIEDEVVEVLEARKTQDSKTEASEDRRRQELAQRLQIDGKGATSEEKRLILNTLLSRSRAFALSPEEMGKTDLYKHDVQLENPDIAPINQKCRRLPYSVRAEVTKEVEKLLKLGIIRPSDSDWASPIVPVRKKTGELRMCIDYRSLNSSTRKDNSPLPNINELLDEAGLNRAKWFSAIDLMMGYHQVAMTEKAQRYAAFVCHLGQFTYIRMPFGLCNAPATFSNLMRKVQATLARNRILVYMDDILVATQTVQEHASQLAQLCDRLIEVGLTIKPEKSTFLKQEVLYLGFIISADGVKADPTKLEAMKNYQRPETPKQMRAFLGLCSYYRRFVKGFAQIASPLHGSLKGKPDSIQWTPEMEVAFEELKKRLTSPPVLAYPQVDRPYYLFTDASKRGLGCVLKQKDEKGRLHPIAYGSRTLTKEEKNYGITDLEAGAVIFGIEHFDVYIRNQECTIVVDHSPLKDILLSKGNLANNRQIRWRNRFMGTGFKIKYTKGANQTVADALSRQPLPNSAPVDPHPTENDPYDDLLEVKTLDDDLVFGTVSSAELNFLQDRIMTLTTLAEGDIGNPRLQGVAPAPESEYTPTRLRAAQEEDKVFKALLGFLEGHKLEGPLEFRKYIQEVAKDCEVSEGVLYYGRSGNIHEMRIAVPSKLRWNILKEVHFYTIGGHFGPEKTYLKLKSRYWWPGMKKDVLMFCRNCLVCRRRQGEKAPWIPPLSHLPIPQKPNDLVGIDLLKMPISGNQFQYIMVATDCLSRKATAVALRTKEATEVAQAIMSNIFAPFGPPKQILTDKGSEFIADVFKQLCNLCGVKNIYTTTFHPQGNSVTERFNRVLVDGLAKLRNTSDISWDIHVPVFLMAYNDTVHRAHGRTPHEVHFGMPMNSISGSPINSLQNPYQYTENAPELVKHAQEIWKVAQESIRKYHEDSERYFEQRLKKDCPFRVGDLVWYRKIPIQKMMSPWTGPWKILELDIPNARIGRRDTQTGRYITEKVHLSNLSRSERPDDTQQWGTATSNKAYDKEIRPPAYPNSFAETAKIFGVGGSGRNPTQMVNWLQNQIGHRFSGDKAVRREELFHYTLAELRKFYHRKVADIAMTQAELEQLVDWLVESEDPELDLDRWLFDGSDQRKGEVMNEAGCDINMNVIQSCWTSRNSDVCFCNDVYNVYAEINANQEVGISYISTEIVIPCFCLVAERLFPDRRRGDVSASLISVGARVAFSNQSAGNRIYQALDGWPNCPFAESVKYVKLPLWHTAVTLNFLFILARIWCEQTFKAIKMDGKGRGKRKNGKTSSGKGNASNSKKGRGKKSEGSKGRESSTSAEMEKSSTPKSPTGVPSDIQQPVEESSGPSQTPSWETTVTAPGPSQIETPPYRTPLEELKAAAVREAEELSRGISDEELRKLPYFNPLINLNEDCPEVEPLSSYDDLNPRLGGIMEYARRARNSPDFPKAILGQKVMTACEMRYPDPEQLKRIYKFLVVSLAKRFFSLRFDERLKQKIAAKYLPHGPIAGKMTPSKKLDFITQPTEVEEPDQMEAGDPTWAEIEQVLTSLGGPSESTSNLNDSLGSEEEARILHGTVGASTTEGVTSETAVSSCPPSTAQLGDLGETGIVPPPTTSTHVSSPALSIMASGSLEEEVLEQSVTTEEGAREGCEAVMPEVIPLETSSEKTVSGASIQQESTPPAERGNDRIFFPNAFVTPPVVRSEGPVIIGKDLAALLDTNLNHNQIRNRDRYFHPKYYLTLETRETVAATSEPLFREMIKAPPRHRSKEPMYRCSDFFNGDGTEVYPAAAAMAEFGHYGFDVRLGIKIARALKFQMARTMEEDTATETWVQLWDIHLLVLRTKLDKEEVLQSLEDDEFIYFPHFPLLQDCATLHGHVVAQLSPGVLSPRIRFFDTTSFPRYLQFRKDSIDLILNGLRHDWKVDPSQIPIGSRTYDTLRGRLPHKDPVEWLRMGQYSVRPERQSRPTEEVRQGARSQKRNGAEPIRTPTPTSGRRVYVTSSNNGDKKQRLSSGSREVREVPSSEYGKYTTQLGLHFSSEALRTIMFKTILFIRIEPREMDRVRTRYLRFFRLMDMVADNVKALIRRKQLETHRTMSIPEVIEIVAAQVNSLGSSVTRASGLHFAWNSVIHQLLTPSQENAIVYPRDRAFGSVIGHALECLEKEWEFQFDEYCARREELVYYHQTGAYFKRFVCGQPLGQLPIPGPRIREPSPEDMITTVLDGQSQLEERTRDRAENWKLDRYFLASLADTRVAAATPYPSPVEPSTSRSFQFKTPASYSVGRGRSQERKWTATSSGQGSSRRESSAATRQESRSQSRSSGVSPDTSSQDRAQYAATEYQSAGIPPCRRLQDGETRAVTYLGKRYVAVGEGRPGSRDQSPAAAAAARGSRGSLSRAIGPTSILPYEEQRRQAEKYRPEPSAKSLGYEDQKEETEITFAENLAKAQEQVKLFDWVSQTAYRSAFYRQGEGEDRRIRAIAGRCADDLSRENSWRKEQLADKRALEMEEGRLRQAFLTPLAPKRFQELPQASEEYECYVQDLCEYVPELVETMYYLKFLRHPLHPPRSILIDSDPLLRGLLARIADMATLSVHSAEYPLIIACDMEDFDCRPDHRRKNKAESWGWDGYMALDWDRHSGGNIRCAADFRSSWVKELDKARNGQTCLNWPSKQFRDRCPIMFQRCSRTKYGRVLQLFTHDQHQYLIDLFQFFTNLVNPDKLFLKMDRNGEPVRPHQYLSANDDTPGILDPEAISKPKQMLIDLMTGRPVREAGGLGILFLCSNAEADFDRLEATLGVKGTRQDIRFVRQVQMARDRGENTLDLACFMDTDELAIACGYQNEWTPRNTNDYRYKWSPSDLMTRTFFNTRYVQRIPEKYDRQKGIVPIEDQKFESGRTIREYKQGRPEMALQYEEMVDVHPQELMEHKGRLGFYLNVRNLRNVNVHCLNYVEADAPATFAATIGMLLSRTPSCTPDAASKSRISLQLRENMRTASKVIREAFSYPPFFVERKPSKPKQLTTRQANCYEKWFRSMKAEVQRETKEEWNLFRESGWSVFPDMWRKQRFDKLVRTFEEGASIPIFPESEIYLRQVMLSTYYEQWQHGMRGHLRRQVKATCLEKGRSMPPIRYTHPEAQLEPTPPMEYRWIDEMKDILPLQSLGGHNTVVYAQQLKDRARVMGQIIPEASDLDGSMVPQAAAAAPGPSHSHERSRGDSGASEHELSRKHAAFWHRSKQQFSSFRRASFDPTDSENRLVQLISMCRQMERVDPEDMTDMYGISMAQPLLDRAYLTEVKIYKYGNLLLQSPVARDMLQYFLLPTIVDWCKPRWDGTQRTRFVVGTHDRLTARGSDICLRSWYLSFTRSFIAAAQTEVLGSVYKDMDDLSFYNMQLVGPRICPATHPHYRNDKNEFWLEPPATL